MIVIVALGGMPLQGTAAGWRRHTKMKGQIIAFRPFDRIVQMASFVENRETFLFRVVTPGSNSRPVIVKLVYEHFGYSDLGEDVTSKSPLLRLRVRRDKTCDETYATFVQNSPTIQDDDGKEFSMEKVVFIGLLEKTNIPAQQQLKCYKMQSGDLEMNSIPR
jgi:hypothetical protein